MPKRYIRMPDGGLKEWRGGSGGSGGVGREEFEAAVEGLSEAIADLERDYDDIVTYDVGTQNLQIGGDNALSTDIFWEYADGLPETNSGLAFVGNAGTAVLRNDGVALSAGAEYRPSVLTAETSAVECVFNINAFSPDTYGFRVQLSNGSAGIRISIYNGELRFAEKSGSNKVIYYPALNTDYTLKLTLDGNGTGSIYLNGELISSGLRTGYELTENSIAQTRAGTTIIKSIKYTFADVAGMISTINGLRIASAVTDEDKQEIAKIAAGLIDTALLNIIGEVE